MKKALLILILAPLAACTELTDLNKSIKSPTSVSGVALYANAQKDVLDLIVDSDVNRNIFRLVVQYWTETTYTDQTQYNLGNRRIPDNWWNALYLGLIDLKLAVEAIRAQDNSAFGSPAERQNQLAMIEIITVYTYSMLVETYGDVPYSEALSADNLLPKYDDGLTVYKDLIARLTTAINQLEPSAHGIPSASDNVYQGNVALWKKFANSLKLRMAILLADTPGQGMLSKTAAEEAVASGVLASNADDATIDYLASQPNNNPLNSDIVLSARADFVIASTLIDKLQEFGDPRLSRYATPVASTSTYLGGAIGPNNTAASFSRIPAQVSAATTPGVVMSYAEVELLLAEASARGYAIPGTAESHYTNGVRASLQAWGCSQAETDAYLARPDVAYNTAQGSWQARIGLQVWLALYNRGYEAWISWRRLDYPNFFARPVGAISDTPVRLTYPVAEQTRNGGSYRQASGKIGGDLVTTRTFWDVK